MAWRSMNSTGSTNNTSNPNATSPSGRARRTAIRGAIQATATPATNGATTVIATSSATVRHRYRRRTPERASKQFDRQRYESDRRHGDYEQRCQCVATSSARPGLFLRQDRRHRRNRERDQCDRDHRWRRKQRHQNCGEQWRRDAHRNQCANELRRASKQKREVFRSRFQRKRKQHQHDTRAQQQRNQRCEVHVSSYAAAGARARRLLIAAASPKITRMFGLSCFAIGDSLSIRASQTARVNTAKKANSPIRISITAVPSSGVSIGALFTPAIGLKSGLHK